ncbi:BRCA2 and CDKN1A-interacting protein [Vombatus ursinus]|uniref:BRCA2 and CDKN1A-interacting protein n=1 Tax=Vombatus ursinus TaxID=29139 RepID=A0A4X2M276_VOMUR|nr:BRCA2 and CDKN1A-interacting protein [Vombatus ursinus]
MASRAKKRALGSRHPEAEEEREETAEDTDESGDDSSGSDEEDEEDEEDELVNQEVNVEFEAHSISSNDFDGIKKLLQQLFLKAAVNIVELTNLLIQQNHIGSVIKQTDVPEESDEEDDEEEEIFGFISLLNLTERKGAECAEQIKELILSLCEKDMVEQLRKLFSDPAKPVGLLLSERFLNVPPQIALPMHQQLQKELAESRQADEPCGKCSYYLMISKTFQEASRNSRNKGNMPHKALRFANAEEEFFYEQALLKFSYSVQEESDLALGGRWSFDDLPMKPLRTVMVIPASKMSAVMETLKEYLSI